MPTWTKLELITQAFDEIGLSGYVYDLSPEQLQGAAKTLESMITSWSSKIRFGYNVSSTPSDIDIDAESGIPDWANEGVYLNLGIRLGPKFGKMIAPDTKQSAKAAYDAMLLRLVQPIERQIPNDFPAGAGNKQWRNEVTPFLANVVNPLQTNEDGSLIYE